MVIEASAGLSDPVSAKLGFSAGELYALLSTCDVLSAPRREGACEARCEYAVV